MNLGAPALPNRARSHGRAASGDERRRVAVPRPSTKGPLEDHVVDDPLSASTPQTSLTAAAPSSKRLLSPTLSNPASAPSPASLDPMSDVSQKDLSYLLDPAAYVVLPATNIPPPFLNSSDLPSVNSPIPELLKSGHYRLAAIAAARTLVTGTSPFDAATIFTLFYTRLCCLCLIGEHSIAAAESKLLGDLTSSFYRHPVTNAHLVPWELRLLAVRLAALGYGEWRKGIMGYYELAREARENAAKAKSEEEQELWKTRLRECGIRVANVLVEMGELEGAGRHLGTLAAVGGVESQEARDTLMMETLVWLRVGDIRAAKRCLSAATSISEDDKMDGVVKALVAMAESDYTLAVSKWKELHEAHPEDPMITQNLAVALLYTGRIAETKTLLTELTDTSPPFHSLVFNLCTVYELCTERHRDRKMALAEKLAARDRAEQDMGWEISNAEFKL